MKRAYIPTQATQPKGVGGVPSANELANKAGVSNEAKIQKIPLSKISGTDYSELDEALKSGKKLTPKEANDLIGRNRNYPQPICC